MTASTDCSFGTVFFQFWLTLALVGIPGVLGGLTNGISIFLKPEDADAEHLPKRSYYLAYGITGFGGSLAALLAILWNGKFPNPLVHVEDLLTLACTGFVSGYIANKLLPAIADKVQKQLTEVQQQQDELKQRQFQLTERHTELAKKSEQGIGNAVNLSTELTAAWDYLSSGSFVAGQTGRLITSLSSLVEAYPTNRPLNILLSRLWEEASKNRKKALEVLAAFIQAKLDLGQSDEDLATAYWNAANYYEDDFEETAIPELRAKAIETFRKALEIAPSYREELVGDDDLAGLRESDEGKVLLKDFNAESGA
jgi:hypothetical protein